MSGRRKAVTVYQSAAIEPLFRRTAPPVVDDRGVHHGVIELERDDSGKQSCGWHMDDVYTCPRCRRICCYCTGHGDCQLCADCWAAGDRAICCGGELCGMVAAEEKQCRVCGCTDGDCSGCVARTGTACSWVALDLCSACVES